MKTLRAVSMGMMGGVWITVCLLLARGTGMRVDLESSVGMSFGLEVTRGAWVTGFLVHLVISGLFGLAYGWAFEHVSHRAGWWVGSMFSIVHMAVIGVLLGLVPGFERELFTLPRPGPFMLGYGTWGVVLFVFVHLLYGAWVGGTYGDVLHPRERSRRRRAYG